MTTPPTLREVSKESAGDPFRIVSTPIANAVLLPDNVEQGNYGEAVGNVLGVAGGVSVIKSAVGSVGKVGQVAEVGSTESAGTVASQGVGNAETKLYSNLRPEDVQPWNGPTWNLQKIGDKYKDVSTGWNADGQYVYVVTKENQVIMSKAAKAGHIDLTMGSDVQYAGTIEFSKGRLKNWTNDSGHYKPLAEEAKNFVDIFRKNGLEDVSMDNFISQQERILPGRE